MDCYKLSRMKNIRITHVLFAILSLLSLVLFVRLWAGAGSYPEIWDLQAQIRQQTRLNAEQQARNEHLQEDVVDISRDDATIEDHARSELGMVKKNEVFYQIILLDDEKEQPPTVNSVAPATHVE